MDLTSWADNVDWECMAGTNGKGREGGACCDDLSCPGDESECDDG